MSGSGMLYGDAALVSILSYIFWGGWVATLAGGVLSVLVMRQPRRLALGVILAVGCLAPLPYGMLWAALHRFAPNEPATSDLSMYGVVAGLAVSVLAAPLATLVCIVRSPRREIAPS